MYDPMAAHRGMKKELRGLGFFALALLTAYIVFVYPHTHDFETSDLQCSELNAFWIDKARKDFAFSPAWDEGTFDCPSKEAGMARALHFISRLDGPMEGKQPRQSFYEWAKDLKPVFNTRILYGLAGRARFDERAIDLSPLLLTKNNWINIAGVLIHELRHLEQGFNSHVPCTANADNVCDAKLGPDPAQGGAYSYNVLFFHHVRQSPATSAYEKRLARDELKTLIQKRFNTISPAARKRFGADGD